MQAGRGGARCTSVLSVVLFRAEVTVQESCTGDGALGERAVPPASFSFEQRQIAPAAAHNCAALSPVALRSQGRRTRDRAGVPAVRGGGPAGGALVPRAAAARHARPQRVLARAGRTAAHRRAVAGAASSKPGRARLQLCNLQALWHVAG
jgi:hypothetical protein